MPWFWKPYKSDISSLIDELKANKPTLEDEQRWYDDAVVGQDNVTFVVRERETGAPIGTTSLFDYRLKHRSCEFGILIGEKSARGRGLGSGGRGGGGRCRGRAGLRGPLVVRESRRAGVCCLRAWAACCGCCACVRCSSRGT